MDRNGTSQEKDLAAENARLRREAAAVDAVTAELLQLQDRDRVLQLIVEKTCELLGAEVSYIALAYPDDREVRVCVAHGDQTGELRRLVHAYGEGLGGRVAQTGEPSFVDNWFQEVAPTPSAAAQILAAEGIVSAMCAPLQARRGLVGVLYAASRKEGSFSQQQLATLQRLGAYAALAIENARLYEQQVEAMQELQVTMSTHQQFLQLVLEDAGLQAIGDTLADLFDGCVVIEGAEGRVLSLSSSPRFPLERVEQSLTVTTHEMLCRPAYGMYLHRTQRSQQVTEVPEVPDAEGRQICRLVAPIVAGHQHLGYVTVIVDASGVRRTDCPAIEQAAVVAALALKRQEAAKAELLRRTLQAQENERMRIARELHDESGQAIAALHVALDTADIALSVAPERARERLAMARSIADGLLDGVHRATADLRPAILDDLGLEAALAWYGEMRLGPLGVVMELENEDSMVRLGPDVEMMVFRVAQEALTNIVRHSGADKVCVSLHPRQGVLVLEIADNGCGFDVDNLDWEDPARPAYGLRGMRERTEMLGGTLAITSARGKGTAVRVEIPIGEKEE
jgi:signal transduction histidine kinase